jgi:predicted ATPase/signal transduction histidine kinase
VDKARFDTDPEVCLQVLLEDGERVFCRGWRADGKPNPLLVVFPATEHAASANLDRLAHEYALKDELDSAWAVRPVELVRERGRIALVLEDPGGEPLEHFLSAPMEIVAFLRLAISIAAALARVHQHRLVHKDIKPANILVDHATGKVRLTGFGIASRLRRERQSPAPPETIAGTLAYMAPEQSGRMNRSIDTRSDLYSFGVTLYRMLTGSLPFTASDPVEWVHCHMARKPLPPHERLPSVPATVSAVVMKLLAKAAEERYQTAAGAESDLRHCLLEWETHHRVDEFALGEHDTPDQLLVPEKLYGRASEIEMLLSACGRVAKSGRPELVFVSGYSGIGKSSVVNELHKALVPLHGFFASGKCDQHKRDIPYATLAQAFQSLIRPLLGTSEAGLHDWRDAFHEALGSNGSLVTNLVPGLQHIIGDQPPASDLPLQDAQARFQQVVRRFIGVFARPEHPLALFLDDLQWIDTATLDLLESLVQELRYLLLIVAYRDNEVDSSHPLIRKLDTIRQTGAILQEIRIPSLQREDLERLIADTLHCELEQATPLAQVVHEKTGGNPFFAIQFIYALAEEELLCFDHEHARWSWDLHRIQATSCIENVVALIIGRLNRLPVETQKAVQQLACVGNRADIKTLSILHGASEEEIHSLLREAVRLELMARVDTSYVFVHDRVQEAVYSLIPEQTRAEVHLRLGRMLSVQTPLERREEAIFDIVNQLNRGAALIVSPDEREQVAELNLVAGKHARASTAYGSALNYLIAGAAMLPEDCWQGRYDLAFALEYHRAECEFLTGNLAAAERRLSSLSHRASNLADRAAVSSLRIDLFMTLDRGDRSVQVGLEYLRSVGITWSPHPTKNEMRQEFQRIWQQLGSRSITELIDLSLMDDSGQRAKMNVLAALLPPALFTDENLFCLIVAHMANVSLENGNSHASCLAYVWLGLLLGPHFDNYPAAFEFGQLGLDLVEKRGLDRFRARVYLDYSHVVNPWMKHARLGPALARRALDVATEVGDLTFAGYSSCNLVSALLASGDPLADIQREAEKKRDLVIKARFGLIFNIITGQLRLILALRGLTPSFSSFDGPDFDEHRFERHLDETPGMAVAIGWYWVRKLQGRFFAEDFLGAIEAAAKMARFVWTIPSHLEIAEYHFYAALARSAYYNTESAQRQSALVKEISDHYKQLEVWVQYCSENFSHRVALVAAEIARIEDRHLDAMREYEKAIHFARNNGFVHDEAVANEVAARFYLAQGFEKIAHGYLRDARHSYLQWGADGKVRRLDQKYPQLTEQEPAPRPRSTIEAPVEHLDLATVIRVSQAVSGEITLERLIDTLMRTAIEHAGAERGVLILSRAGERQIHAEATTNGDTVVVRVREEPITAAILPETIVNYVVRTQESVIIEDATTPNSFSLDEYLSQRHARSVLGLPLLKQATLIGMLYLENNLAPHVFTPARIAVLKLLVAQATMSLENTRLYRDLEEREAKIREVQMELTHANRVAAMGQLTASIAHEVNQPVTGTVVNADAALRWLAAQPPDLENARKALARIVRDGHRAGAVIGRIRELIKKAPPQKSGLDINEAILEVIGLSRAEMVKNGISVQTRLQEGLPIIQGDRVQLQQVILNLIVNAIEAMSGTAEGPRELLISTEKPDSGATVLVAIRDSGPGLAPASLEQVFEAFYTTKLSGLGMGLSICRSIIEAHGGRLWATANESQGALFQFVMPAVARDPS